MSFDKHLIRKYNIPGPRYTSYPTVPYWEADTFSEARWRASVSEAFSASNAKEGISVYIHLPFCESLCTFCGCHKHITKRHSVESPYVKAVLAEWASYRALFDGTPRIKELHLGGGTPTFFSPDHLRDLLEGIFAHAELCDTPLLSFEAHPNNTTRAHLEVLHSLGFRRNSFGIQDYDPVVQKAINRIQSFEDVKRVTDESREVGYTSVSHDLVFGLPHQSLEAMAHTIDKTAELKPDRIAFYSYAHVPWIKGTGQRGYDEQGPPQQRGQAKPVRDGQAALLGVGLRGDWHGPLCAAVRRPGEGVPRRFLAPQFHGLHLGQDPVDGGVGDVGHQRFVGRVCPKRENRGRVRGAGDEGGDSGLPRPHAPRRRPAGAQAHPELDVPIHHVVRRPRRPVPGA